MASHIEVKIGQLTYRHDFAETDTKVRGALQRFAASQEPPVPANATATQQLEDAVEKIVRLVSWVARQARVAELRDEQAINLDTQADTDTGLAHTVPEPPASEEPQV